tara:strand:+ start:680 stop:1162 length:483 start_codon:yes stop_codon:yes gene_type:complete
MKDDLAKKYFGGGVVTNDARSRMGNNAPPNETQGMYVDPYNEDIAPVLTSGGTMADPVPDKPLGPPNETEGMFEDMLSATEMMQGPPMAKGGKVDKKGLKKGKGLKNKKGGIKTTKGKYKTLRKPVDFQKKPKNRPKSRKAAENVFAKKGSRSQKGRGLK